MAKNDVRIRKSFENKCLGGYISIEKVNKDDNKNNNEKEENEKIIEARYEMIYDSFGKLKNRQEIWDYKLNVLLDFIKNNNRVPNKTEKHKNINIGNWFRENRRKINSTEDEYYKQMSKNEILKNNLNKYLENKKTNKKINTFEESFEIFKDYVEKNNLIPTQKYNTGRWFQDCKQKINSKEDKLYKILSFNKIVKDNLDKYLEKKELNREKKKMTGDEIINLLIEFVEKHNRVPKYSEKYNNINMGVCLRTQKSKINSIKDKTYIKLSKNKIIKENLDEYLKIKNSKTDNKKLSFDDNLNLLIEFIEKYNRTPKKKDKYKNANIFGWFWDQKVKVKYVNDEIYTKLSKNKIIKENLNKYIKTKELNKIKYNYEEKIEALLEYVKEEKKVPQKKSTHENINIGIFLINLKTKLKSKDDEIYKKLSKNNILKENLDEYLDTKKKKESKNIEKLSKNEKINLLIEFVEKNKRLPKRTEEYKNINICGFLNTCKSKINSTNDDLYKKLSKNQILKKCVDKYLTSKELNKNKEILSFNEILSLLNEFIKKYNRNPTSKEAYKNVNIGIWLDNQKKKLKTKDDELYKKLSENEFIKQNLDKYLSNTSKLKK